MNDFTNECVSNNGQHSSHTEKDKLWLDASRGVRQFPYILSTGYLVSFAVGV